MATRFSKQTRLLWKPVDETSKMKKNINTISCLNHRLSLHRSPKQWQQHTKKLTVARMLNDTGCVWTLFPTNLTVKTRLHTTKKLSPAFRLKGMLTLCFAKALVCFHSLYIPFLRFFLLMTSQFFWKLNCPLSLYKRGQLVESESYFHSLWTYMNTHASGCIVTSGGLNEFQCAKSVCVCTKQSGYSRTVLCK